MWNVIWNTTHIFRNRLVSTTYLVITSAKAFNVCIKTKQKQFKSIILICGLCTGLDWTRMYIFSIVWGRGKKYSGCLNCGCVSVYNSYTFSLKQSETTYRVSPCLTLSIWALFYFCFVFLWFSCCLQFEFLMSAFCSFALDFHFSYELFSEKLRMTLWIWSKPKCMVFSWIIIALFLVLVILVDQIVENSVPTISFLFRRHLSHSLVLYLYRSVFVAVYAIAIVAFCLTLELWHCCHCHCLLLLHSLLLMLQLLFVLLSTFTDTAFGSRQTRKCLA